MKGEHGMSRIENLIAQMTGSGLSRRQFINRTAALWLSVSAAALMLDAAPAKAEPKRGGSVKIAINDGAQTDSYDPATWQSSFTQVIFGGTLCNALTEIGPDDTILPDLAESFEASTDLAKWTFKLRNGLTFHNGKPVTSNDVIESFRYHMAPNSTSAAKAMLESIADIKADGPQTVIFTLKGGNADFPYVVSDNHLAVFPAKAGGGIDWAAGIATGPFMIESFQPGISAKMKRNPAYHKPGQPYFDAVEFVNIIDVAARTNALITGEIDYMVDVDLKTMTLLDRNPTTEILRTRGVRHFTFDMNTQVAPFDNPDLRKALKYAIDREDIVKKALLGNAVVSNDNPIAPQIKYAFNPTPQHNYDVEKAKEYLKKSGLSNVTLDLSVADTAFPGAMDAALLFKDHAAKAGITINVIREADDGYWDKVWQHKPFVGVDWLGRPTCDSLFTTVYAQGAPWNDTQWKNPRFDELLISGRATADDAKRQAIYAEMQQILHDDGGTIVLAYAFYIDATSKKLAHGKIGSTLQCDNLRMAERWWLA